MQVLGNIVVNAYHSIESTIGVTKSGNLAISSHMGATYETVCIVIQDTGVGIPAESINNFFEPLFTNKAKGIGLGLAVSEKLIEANGGRIEVQSEAGMGSTFSLYLPVYKEL